MGRRKSGKVRVAMIGAGSMANAVHYPSLASFDDVQIAAIAELNPERLNATADKYGVAKRYGDYRQMVEEVAPDAVYAIGPPDMMYDIWTWCLEQGQNLCIEKPMGITMHQARALAYLGEKHGCITQVGFQRRASPLLVKLREECLKRGPITYALCQFYKCAIEPCLGARDHMMDDGVHAIDTLRWACGGEVVKVESHSKRLGVPDINFFAATLLFDNGAIGFLVNHWATGRRTFHVEMHALGVYAEGDPEGRGYVYADGKAGATFQAAELSGGDERWRAFGFRDKNREFIDAVRNKTQPASCFADAIKTMQVAETILAQALLEGDISR